MNCANCSKARPVPACIGDLIVGTIATNNIPVFVHFKDITQNRTTVREATADDNGLVTVAMDDQMWPENHSFELTVTESLNTAPVDITVGGTAYDCIGVRFVKYYSESGDVEEVITHTIEME